MATTRTVMTPDGDVITLDTATQTVMTPSGSVVNATIEAAGGGTNISAGVVTKTITAYNASISFDVNISAGTVSKTLTAQNATISFDVNISAGSVAKTLTAHNASISAAINIAAGTVSKTVTALNCTINFGTTVSAGTVAKTLTAYNATIAYDVNVSAGSVSKTVTTLNASITHAVAAPGGDYNAAHYFPTGQVDVTIKLYDPKGTDAAEIALDTAVCVEVGSTGLYMWDISNITTLPTPRKEYGYVMTDGVTSEGGIITYDDFLIQYLIHNEYGI